MPSVRDARCDPCRHLRVRAVVAGEPVAGIFLLALRPNLARLAGIVVVGLDEIEASSRRGAVPHTNASARAGSIEGDAQRASVVRPLGRSFVDDDLLDCKSDRIELDLRSKRIGSLDVERRDRSQTARRDLERDVEVEMHDGKWTAAFEVTRCRRRGERPRPRRAQGFKFGVVATCVRTVLDRHRGRGACHGAPRRRKWFALGSARRPPRPCLSALWETGALSDPHEPAPYAMFDGFGSRGASQRAAPLPIAGW